MKTQEEAKLKILQQLERSPGVSQRQLASQLGLSLGKTNYCLRALVDKGFVKVQNFQSSSNKRGYSYLLTPAGAKEKLVAMRGFLQFKQREYEALKSQIEVLTSQLKEAELKRR